MATNPIATVLDAAEAPRLRPGRKPAGDGSVAASQRGRLIGACLHMVGDKGFAATTVGDIVARAKVSRVTFYEYFATKEECFLTAYDAVQKATAAGQRRAGRAYPDARAGFVAGLDSYIKIMLAQPSMVRVFHIEIYAAGPAGHALRRRAIDEWAGQLVKVAAEMRRQDPSFAALTRDLTQSAAVGVVVTMMEHMVRAVEASERPRRAPLRAQLLDAFVGAVSGGTEPITAMFELPASKAKS